jgi:polar amino acid transport system substrate-binding protein
MIERLLKASLTVLLLSAPLGGIVSTAAAGPAPGGGCLLRTAWEPYDPFTFVDSEGILTGADIELLKVVAEEIGCELSFRGMPWNRILLEIEKGAVDVTSSASWTPERDKWAWFSAPYRSPKTALFVRKGATASHGLGELADVPRIGFRLGVIEGYFLGEEFARLMDDPAFFASVEGAADYPVNLTKLLHGRIDGFLVDDVDVLRAEAQALGVLDAVEQHPLEVEVVNLHYMFSRKTVSRDTFLAFDQALRRMKAAGRVDAIFQKFLTNSSK